MSRASQKPRLSLPEFVALMGMMFATVAFSIDAMLPAMSEIAAELSPAAPNRAQPMWLLESLKNYKPSSKHRSITIQPLFYCSQGDLRVRRPRRCVIPRERGDPRNPSSGPGDPSLRSG